MVFKCSVPFCRGNYDNGPKVSVVSLPKNEELKKKWLHAIPRENMPSTKNFKVCELHFDPADVRRHSEYFDAKTDVAIKPCCKATYECLI
ncbi:unnamed protein product [Larinioides sclopetarius]|uniref:THAP-type domain-containing protein n=1 Tax=Larinioides sclopetarius TaxID=280406 RepID=A0AAV1Z1T1_9ARAC